MPYQNQNQRVYSNTNKPAKKSDKKQSLPQRGQRAAINRQKQQAKVIRGAYAK